MIMKLSQICNVDHQTKRLRHFCVVEFAITKKKKTNFLNNSKVDYQNIKIIAHLLAFVFSVMSNSKINKKKINFYEDVLLAYISINIEFKNATKKNPQ